MAARENLDISPLLFFINFEINLDDARGDNTGDISQITLTAM